MHTQFAIFRLVSHSLLPDGNKVFLKRLTSSTMNGNPERMSKSEPQKFTNLYLHRLHVFYFFSFAIEKPAELNIIKLAFLKDPLTLYS